MHMLGKFAINSGRCKNFMYYSNAAEFNICGWYQLSPNRKHIYEFKKML